MCILKNHKNYLTKFDIVKSVICKMKRLRDPGMKNYLYLAVRSKISIFKKILES